jgi:hypothetical protein
MSVSKIYDAQSGDERPGATKRTDSIALLKKGLIGAPTAAGDGSARRLESLDPVDGHQALLRSRRLHHIC